MNVENEVLLAHFLGEVGYLLFQGVSEEQTALDGALAHAGRTGLLYPHIHGWAHSLTGYLHESELAQWQYVMSSPILLHILTHALIEHLTVFSKVHVDEIDNDDATNIAQTQLASQLVSCSQVYVEGVSLLFVSATRTVATVHIHHMHSLSMFYNKVSAMLVVYRLAKARLHLLGDIEIIKDRHLAIIQFHDSCTLRGYHLHIAFHLLIDCFVVDPHVFVGWVKQIAKHGNGTTGFLKHQLRTVSSLLYSALHILPTTYEL